jgi:hypothetical protein
MRETLHAGLLVSATAVCLALSSAARWRQPESASIESAAQERQVLAPQFKPIAGAPEGTQEASVFTQALPQVHARLEIRTILVPAGKPISFAVENEALFELRTGSLATVSDGKTEARQRGDMWQLSRGSQVTLQASGELAALRAIYLIPNQ